MTKKSKGLFFLLLSIMLAATMPTWLNGAIPEQERTALIALYTATNGDYWNHYSNWKTTPLEADGFAAAGTEGTWYGVTVEGDHVTKLRFHQNNLDGPLPEELGDLTQLTSLSMEGNSLSGNIPPQLGNLVNLTGFWLGDNKLSGTIPIELADLTCDLRLEKNQLSGTIPVELANYKGQYINLMENRLTGAIPSELGSMPNIRWLVLGRNKLTGGIPNSIYNLTNLIELGLRENLLSGTISPDIGNMTSLVCLVLEGNKFSGEVPSTLRNLPNLDGHCVYIAFNALYSNDTALKDFLVGGGANWFYQTLPPTAPFVSDVTPTTATINWTPIEYQYDGYLYLPTVSKGGYRVFYSSSETGPWTEAGSTVDKTESSFTVTGLTPDTTYYFKVQTFTDPFAFNQSQVSSDFTLSVSSNQNSVESPATDVFEGRTAVTGPGTATTFTLSIQSSPGSGVPVTVSPSDKNGADNGATTFSRTYDKGAVVTVTAPAEAEGDAFTHWTLDGKTTGGPTLSVTMDRNHTAIANYGTGTVPDTTHTLTVRSSPESGAEITVTPADNNGDGSGTATFTRLYNQNTEVTVTAPAAFGDYVFSKWTLNGVASTGTAITLTMDDDYTLTAVYTADTTGTPEPALNRERLNFAAVAGGKNPGSQELTIDNTGTGILNWSASADVDWIELSSASGSGAGRVTVSIVTAGMTAGAYTGHITVSAENAAGSPKTVSVYLKLLTAPEVNAPFGEFSTPLEGTTVRSSIPVTGWVLSDVGIESVKLYRAENGVLQYVGDALLVEGARPDVEAAYPDHPLNYKAGWGYMMLTNYLPNGGNGTYTFHAIATDTLGNQATLGVKTFTSDNANAVNPFGAIDTPTQGGAAAGGRFINWGWVLTPQPNKIPEDGSTIEVIVDGVKQGNPVYNIYRSDIAGFFPGYANTGGAVGYFYLDTTGLDNGLHTIQWRATDSGNNTDGIGSRFFTVYNSDDESSRMSRRTSSPQRFNRNTDLSSIPASTSQPQLVKRGEGSGDKNDTPILFPANHGLREIMIRQLEAFSIRLHQGKIKNIYGFGLAGGKRIPLPVGSTLNRESNTFSWLPGPGFNGKYRLVFVFEASDGRYSRSEFIINIVPRFE